MIYAVLQPPAARDAARRARLGERPAAPPTASTISRSPTPTGRTEALQPADAVRPTAPPPQAGRGAQRVDPGGERIPTVGVTGSSGWTSRRRRRPRPGRRTPARGLRWSRGSTSRRTSSWCGPMTRGDFSTYTLRLVASRHHSGPPTGFDPLLVEVEFSFKVECPTDFDCRPSPTARPRADLAPTIDYLAKDYDTFRRLMLDRLSLTTPGLDGAQPRGRRCGARRAARLRRLTSCRTARTRSPPRPTSPPPAGVPRCAATPGWSTTSCTRAATRGRGSASRWRPRTSRSRPRSSSSPVSTAFRRWSRPAAPTTERALAAGAVVFEPVDTTFGPDDTDRAPLADVLRPSLHQSLNELDLYTWGDTDCCLPIGATSATLQGHHAAKLRPGHLLVLAEVAGPVTGVVADADPAHRCVVRLTSVSDAEDASGGLFHDPARRHAGPRHRDHLAPRRRPDRAPVRQRPEPPRPGGDEGVGQRRAGRPRAQRSRPRPAPVPPWAWCRNRC